MASHVTAISRQDLKFIKELGKGGFSTVYQVIYTLPTRQRIEAAGIESSPLRYERQFEEEFYRTPRRRRQYIHAAAKKLNKAEKKELQLLSKLKHPFIIRLYGVVDEIPDFYLVLELCEGGSLRSYLTQHKTAPLHPSLAYSWGEQGARAVEYLHQQGVIHRDLKADNFLISKTKNLKLCDFGLSKNADKTVTTCAKGTWGWTAPESFSEDHLSPLSDLYAFACVIWELITRKLPFEGCGYENVMYRVCTKGERPEIPEECPDEIVELLKKCWSGDRIHRPTIDQVVQVISGYREKIQCDYCERGETLNDILPYTCAKIQVIYGAREEDDRDIRLPSCIRHLEEDIVESVEGVPDLYIDEQDIAVQRPFQLFPLLQRPPLKRQENEHQEFLLIPHGTPVAKIKQMIDKDSPEKLHLFTTPAAAQDMELTEDHTMLDYKLSAEKTTIYLDIICQIRVTYEGGDICIGVSQREDISVLKSKIFDEVCIPVEAQQLSHEGHTLHDSNIISQFVNKEFEATFHLKCHEKISVVVQRRGQNSKEETVGDATIPVSFYPSQTIKDIVEMLKRDHDVSFKREALLYQGQVLFTTVYKSSKRNKLHQLLLEASIKNGSVLHVETPIQVCICAFNLETGNMITSPEEDSSDEEYDDYMLPRGSRLRPPVDLLVIFSSQTINDVTNNINLGERHASTTGEGTTEESKRIRLRFHGTNLEDSHSVSDYGIRNGNKIVVEHQLQVCIEVRGDIAKRIIVDAWESDTITDLKTTGKIEPDKKYLMLSRKALVSFDSSSRSLRRQHTSERYEDRDTCSVLTKDRVNGLATLFLLDPNHVMTIHARNMEAKCRESRTRLLGNFRATVTPCLTIQDLKECIEHAEHDPYAAYHHFREVPNVDIFFKGSKLEDDMTLLTSGIRDGSVLDFTWKIERVSTTMVQGDSTFVGGSSYSRLFERITGQLYHDK